MDLPSGPQTPSFFQVFLWVFSPISFLEHCAKTYGDIFTLKLRTKAPPIIFVSNPKALQQILTSDTKELSAPGELNQILSTYLLGENSVVSVSGKEHERQRQLLMPSFHGERMRSYNQIIINTTQDVMQQLPIGQPFNVRSVTQDITLQVIMQAVFGLNQDQRRVELQYFLNEIIEKASSISHMAVAFIPALEKIPGVAQLREKQLLRRQKARELLYREIHERRENPDPSRTDILNLLLSATDQNGQPMTDIELQDELITLVVTGHDSTTTALAWALYWIHKMPSVREKLLAELDDLEPNPDSTTIFKLPYLNAVYCETLRIHPVTMTIFPRQVKTSLSLSGYKLPADTILSGAIYLTHHREDLYPEPHLFRPERFLEKQFSPYEYLPFGGGARRCIGLAFAQLEMKLAIAHILSNYELELINTRDVKPKRRGLVTGPDHPIRMKIKSRRQAKSPALV